MCVPDFLVASLGLEQLDEGVAHGAPTVVQVLELVVFGLVVTTSGPNRDPGSAAPRGCEAFAGVAADLRVGAREGTSARRHGRHGRHGDGRHHKTMRNRPCGRAQWLMG